MDAVESMMFVGSRQTGVGVPWHGKGVEVPIDKKLNVKEAIEASGLGWQVSLAPLQIMSRANMVATGISEDIADKFSGCHDKFVDKFATVRMSDNSVLGVVSSSYTPLQNEKAFEFFQPYLDSGSCTIDTCGSLFCGQKVWILAKLNREPLDINGDKVDKFLLISNGHDGKTSVKVSLNPIRVVCANTLTLAHSVKAAQTIRIRHSSQVETNLKLIQESINTIDNCFETTAELYRKMQNKHINQNDLRRFMKVVLKIDENIPDKDLPTRTNNRLDELINLALNGKGNSGKTLWDCFNGVSEFTSWGYGRNVDSRLDGLWFGNGSIMNQTAFDLAVQLSA